MKATLISSILSILVLMGTPFGSYAQFRGQLTKDVEMGEFKVAPYLQFGTKNSMVIMWETHEPSTSTVLFGKARLGDLVPNLEQKQGNDSLKTMHEIVLSGLTAETKYMWKVQTTTAMEKTIESEHSTFSTSVNDDTAYGFILYGDSQSNPKVWGQVATLGWLQRPNFGLLAGDLVDRGGMNDDWLDEFFPPAHIFMNRYPLYSVIGNHEDDHPNYYKYMHNPAPEYYYTFTYGNAQYFMIDTNRDVSEGSEQYDWLEWELAKSTATWKFVVHHHPPYSSEENDHGDSWTGLSTKGTEARNLIPLYEMYGVDFCFFGHVHMYERTWPIFQGAVNQENGVVYINSGGAGGGLENFDPVRSWFTKKVKSTHHLCYFTVHDNSVSFQAIDNEGVLFDSFELTKEKGIHGQKAEVRLPPPPRVTRENPLFLDTKEIKMRAALEDLTIRYTLDGSTPNMKSTAYEKPFSVNKTTTIKAIAFSKDGIGSRLVERIVTKARLVDAQNLDNPSKGLQFKLYVVTEAEMSGFDAAVIDGTWDELLSKNNLTPKNEGVISSIGLKETGNPESYFSLVIQGFVDVPEDGIYGFYTNSDDGSKLFINDKLIVDNGGYHGGTVKKGQAALKKGFHQLRVTYFQGSGSYDLSAGWISPSGIEQPIPMFKLFH